MPKSKYTRAPGESPEWKMAQSSSLLTLLYHATEILEHCNRMGTMFNLYERTLFQTECIEARWDDSIMRWICKTDRGDVLRVQFLVSSTGPLHKIKLPGVPGIEKFKKTTFHTARWNYDYTGGDSFGNLNKLADKRVAIIGTGATAIQCIPYLGESSCFLYVFQRTPSSIDERRNSDTDPEWWRQYTSKPGWQIERDTNFIQITSGNPQPVDLVRSRNSRPKSGS